MISIKAAVKKGKKKVIKKPAKKKAPSKGRKDEAGEGGSGGRRKR